MTGEKPLTAPQFRHALKCGLGRALQHVQQFGAAGHVDAITYAATHSLAYDAQSEGTRGEWIWEIMEGANVLEHVRPFILHTAQQESYDTWTVDQLFDLLVKMAQRGDEEARQLLYKSFRDSHRNEDWLGGAQIIELDGVEGIAHVADIIGMKMEPGESQGDAWLFEDACRTYGEDAVTTAVRKAAENNQNVQRWFEDVEAIRRKEAEKEQSETAPFSTRQPPTIDEIRRRIGTETERWLNPVSAFVCNASREVLDTLYWELLEEKDPVRLSRYLAVFREHTIPDINDYLLSLLDHEDEMVRNSAYSALGNIRSDRLRELAVEQMRSHNRQSMFKSCQLLVGNYQPGDAELLLPGLTAVALEEMMKPLDNEDEDEGPGIHSIGRVILDIAGAHPGVDLAPLLHWLYENGPCASCRLKVLKQMKARGVLSTEIVEECAFDCYDEIREFAASLNSTST